MALYVRTRTSFLCVVHLKNASIVEVTRFQVHLDHDSLYWIITLYDTRTLAITLPIPANHRPTTSRYKSTQSCMGTIPMISRTVYSDSNKTSIRFLSVRDRLNNNYSTQIRCAARPLVPFNIRKNCFLRYFEYLCAYGDVTRFLTMYDELRLILYLAGQSWSTPSRWPITCCKPLVSIPINRNHKYSKYSK